jgi:hypothetical protein
VVEAPGPVVLREPQTALLELEQVTAHLTPALVESFMRVTASEAVALSWRDGGAVVLKEMEIGSAGAFVEDEPPQATSAALAATAVNRKIHLRKGMVASVSSILLADCFQPIVVAIVTHDHILDRVTLRIGYEEFCWHEGQAA